jgi:hypothetical protein
MKAAEIQQQAEREVVRSDRALEEASQRLKGHVPENGHIDLKLLETVVADYRRLWSERERWVTQLQIAKSLTEEE